MTRNYARWAEAKAARVVRTPEGAEKYGQPIGSVIVPDAVPERAPRSVRSRATSVSGATTQGSRVLARASSVSARKPGGRVAAPATPAPARGKPLLRLQPATPEDRARLRIPPAWTDVEINTNPRATLVARGRDAKGRVQSIYSAEHTAAQAAKKFQRIKVLAGYMDKLDAALERDALDSDEAAALVLIRKLGMRPGSNRNTGADVDAFGASNLQARHAKVTPGGQTNLNFTGKKGVSISLKTKDPLVAAVVESRLATRSRNVPLFDTNENRVRDYYRQHVPEEFQLKDLRTLHANVIALNAVDRVKRGKPKTKTEFRRMRKAVAEEVSGHLGNTPTIALASYISPAVFDPWFTDPDWA